MDPIVSDTAFGTSAELRRTEMKRDPAAFTRRLREWQAGRRFEDGMAPTTDDAGQPLTWLENMLSNPIDFEFDESLFERDRGHERGTPLDLFE